MLQVYVGESIEPLSERLAERLRVPTQYPLERELVAVPGGGMNRWIRLVLARHLGAAPGRHDGVAANIDFVFPGTIRSRLMATTKQHDPAGLPEPWSIERLVWTVLRIIQDDANAAALGPLRTLPVGATWFGRARSIADLFDHYSVHRPAMLRAWHSGFDVDASGETLKANQQWQPALWRLVRDAIGTESNAERLPGLLHQLRNEPTAFSTELPSRLTVFGTSSFPGGQEFIELLDALAVHRTVDLYLVAPSLASRDTNPIHPLLRTWGKPSHEAAQLARQNSLIEHPIVANTASRAETDTSTVLRCLQSDIRSNSTPRSVHLIDESVQIHNCFGPIRQLEACRDAVLAALANDPTLQESDINILIPDLVRFAPLIPSVFGPSSSVGGGHTRDTPTPSLRYVVTDRSLETTTEYVQGVLSLLRLLPGRFSRSELLDFIGQSAVRHRFSFDNDAATTIEQWSVWCNVRWGLNASHRERWSIPRAFDVNTWRSALDQLLLGVAIFDDLPALGPGDVAARGVEGNDVELLGRLASLVDLLEQLVSSLAERRTIDGWTTWWRLATDELLAPPDDEEWQHDQVRELLISLADAARADGQSPEVTFTEFSQLLSRSLRGTPGRNRFYTGGVTVTSMQPMRWLPSRVTCLVGLDESAFAAPFGTGDDLVAQHSMLGDIEPRSDRRQGVLETILSTTDKLIITRTANNERTNATVPPAIAVAEFLDVLTTMTNGEFTTADHARQIFDPRHLQPGTTTTFDERALRSATAKDTRETHERWMERPLPDHEVSQLSLKELRSFLGAPARTFFNARLQVRLTSVDDMPDENLPITLDSLANWTLTDTLLNSTTKTDDWAYFHRQAGDLPAGAAANIAISQLTETVAALSEAAHDAFQPGVPFEPINVDLQHGETRLIGVIDRLVANETEPAILHLSNSRSNPKLVLLLWFELVIATLAEPDVHWRATLVSRNRKTSKKEPVTAIEMSIGGDSTEERLVRADTALTQLLDLYHRALNEPLPLFAKTSGELFLGETGDGSWDPYGFPGEADDPYNAEVWGGEALETLLDLPAMPHDPTGADPGRFVRFANLLWGIVHDSIDGPVHV